MLNRTQPGIPGQMRGRGLGHPGGEEMVKRTSGLGLAGNGAPVHVATRLLPESLFTVETCPGALPAGGTALEGPGETSPDGPQALPLHSCRDRSPPTAAALSPAQRVGCPLPPCFPPPHACRPTGNTGSAWGPRILTSSPALKGKTGKLRSFKPTGAFNKTSLASLCPAGDRSRVREDRGWPPPSMCQSPPASWAKTPLLIEELTASRGARPRRSQQHGTGQPLSNLRGSVLSTQHVQTELPTSTCLQANLALHVKG